jgi:hypothetical protein
VNNLHSEIFADFLNLLKDRCLEYEVDKLKLTENEFSFVLLNKTYLTFLGKDYKQELNDLMAFLMSSFNLEGK